MSSKAELSQMCAGIESHSGACAGVRREIPLHGKLMLLSYGFLVPLAVAVAVLRHTKQLSSRWFHLHRAIQTVAFLISLVGIKVAISANNIALEQTHKTLGYTITALGSLQWATAVLRPGQDAQLHQAWSTWHKTLGKGALAMALVNIFIGLTIGQAPIPYYIWQALVVIGLFMVVLLRKDIEQLMNSKAQKVN